MTRDDLDKFGAEVTVGQDGILVTTHPGTIIAGACDIPIDKGSSWTLVITWMSGEEAAKDLNGYAVRFVVRQNGTDLVDLDEGDGITLAAEAPNITISLSAAETAALTFARAPYTLVLTSGDGVVRRLLEGEIVLRGEVGAE